VRGQVCAFITRLSRRSFMLRLERQSPWKCKSRAKARVLASISCRAMLLTI